MYYADVGSDVFGDTPDGEAKTVAEDLDFTP
jgi:hypothetical protein